MSCGGHWTRGMQKAAGMVAVAGHLARTLVEGFVFTLSMRWGINRRSPRKGAQATSGDMRASNPRCLYVLIRHISPREREAGRRNHRRKFISAKWVVRCGRHHFDDFGAYLRSFSGGMVRKKTQSISFKECQLDRCSRNTTRVNSRICLGECFEIGQGEHQGISVPVTIEWLSTMRM